MGVVVFCVILFGSLFALAVSDDEKLRALDAERRADEDLYWDEVWEDGPQWDDPDYEPISFDAWYRERDAPRLPPAKIKPTTPYR